MTPRSPVWPALTAGLLADLVADGIRWPAPHPVALDRLAVAYLVVGSRLGTQVIARGLEQEGPEDVPRYFAPRDNRVLWQGVCETLSTAPSCGGRADRIVSDIRVGYRVFLRAARPGAPDITKVIA